LGDKFDKAYGINLALRRAKGVEPTPALPGQVVKQHREFQVRCLRYFKQASVLSTQGAFVAPPSLEDQLLSILPPEFRTLFAGLPLEGIGIGIVG
jgi:hypothetical protein